MPATLTHHISVKVKAAPATAQRSRVLMGELSRRSGSPCREVLHTIDAYRDRYRDRMDADLADLHRRRTAHEYRS